MPSSPYRKLLYLREAKREKLPKMGRYWVRGYWLLIGMERGLLLVVKMERLGCGMQGESKGCLQS